MPLVLTYWRIVDTVGLIAQTRTSEAVLALLTIEAKEAIFAFYRALYVATVIAINAINAFIAQF